MNDYTPYRDTFRVRDWTLVRIREEWLHPNHIFGLRNPIRREITQWLDSHNGGCYAILDDLDEFIENTLAFHIAFSREIDATAFLLRWT